MQTSRGRLLTTVVLTLVTAACGGQNQIMSAHESGAIFSIRSLQQAQTQYYSLYGKYAATLAELGPPASGPAGPTAADLIPKDMTGGKKDGYEFVLKGTPKGFTVNANPEQFNTTGRRTFFSDETLTIRANPGPDPATAASPELK